MSIVNQKNKKLILIAEDDISIRTVLSSDLEQKFNLKLTDSASQLWEWVSNGVGDLIILDVVMPDANGIELIPKIKEIRPEIKIIVISAQNTLLTAMQAIEKGAYEYLSKPFSLNEMNKVINRAFSEKKINKKKINDKDIKNEIDLPIIGRSALMQQTYKTIAKLVGTDLEVIIIGESGTGKELIAKILHDHGLRKNGPFVAINMAALPKDLIESELFGHEKGAFTGANSKKSGKFEQAENGTLFLDEIGDMPYDAQTKLLRVLQEKEFTPIGSNEKLKTNVRIIAATHQDLGTLIKDGIFREDLFYRLNVIPINLPPLRLRLDDIKDLTNHFLIKCSKEGLNKKDISDEAILELKKYHWPGNVRELENFIRRLIVLVSSNTINKGDVEKNLQIINSFDYYKLPIYQNSLSVSVEKHLNNFFKLHKDKLPSAGLYSRILSEIERPLISICLNATKGNQIKASKLLGLNRNTLRKKIKELQIKYLKNDTKY